MRRAQVLCYSMIAGWFVTALAAVLVAMLLVSEQSRSPYFWHRVCWTEALIFLCWGGTGFYLLASGKTKDDVTRFGGIAPTISIVTAIYALLSFSVMLIHAFMDSVEYRGRGNEVYMIKRRDENCEEDGG